MIQVALHEQDYLQVAKHYMQIYETKIVKEDRTKMLEVALQDMPDLMSHLIHDCVCLTRNYYFLLILSFRH